MSKLTFIFCLLVLPFVYCAHINIHILKANVIPNCQKPRLALVVDDKMATPRSHASNPMVGIFGEPDAEKSYTIFLSSILLRNIKAKTRFSEVEFISDTIAFHEIYPKKNGYLPKVLLDTIKTFDYLLLIEDICAEFASAHYESGSTRNMGVQTVGVEHLPGMFCESANVSLINCRNNTIYQYGYIYSCCKTNALSRSDLYVFADRLIKEVFENNNEFKAE